MDNKQFLNIMAQRLNLENSTAEKLLEGFVGIIGEECRNLNRIAIPGFGSFQGEKRDEKVVKDLSTGRRLLLPPTIELEFIPGGRLKNEVAEGRGK